MKIHKFIISRRGMRVVASFLTLIFSLTVLTGCGEESSVSSISADSENSVEAGNVQSLSFSSAKEITVTVGKEASQGYIVAKVKNSNVFSADEIEFISENPSVATVSLSNVALSTFLYYKVTGVSVGETAIYARTKDGTIISEKKTVIVTGSFQNITKLSFAETAEQLIKMGHKSKQGVLNVTRSSSLEYSEDDVLFVSENTEVAVITPVKSSFGRTVYYEIEAIHPGETYVYAITKDGALQSEKIKVTVPAPIDVNAISFNVSEANLGLSESIVIQASVSPDDADDKEIIWKSTDSAIATVDQDGKVTGVSGGSTTITATCSNGVSKSITVSVDGSKRIMRLRVTHQRQDDVNVGNDWIYTSTINGVDAGGDCLVTVGETLNLYAKYTEADDNPDVGESSKSYIVAEADLLNGFVVTLDLYVTENGGPNAGKRAHFIVTFTFSVK